MHLNSFAANDYLYVKPGHLYVVATPIGNRDDITLRALYVLKNVNLIAAEDTRQTAKLLSFYQIKNKLISFHEHNEKQRTALLINKLKKGICIALVSNAGTPTISDPGYRLVNAAAKSEIPVVPIPGVCAPAAALSVSGLPTDSFVFLGFLDRKKQKRLRQIESIKNEKKTIIIYESPRRILALLCELNELISNRFAILAREMTKIHEEFLRGSINDLKKELINRPDIKGECTLLLAGQNEEPVLLKTIRKEIENELKAQGSSVSQSSKVLAKKYNVSRKTIYDEILKIKSEK